MAITINEFDVYYINGKIIDINGSTFTISVTSPFTCEVKFHCNLGYYNILHPPISSKYTWISWVQGDGHPSSSEAAAYYNTKNKCFYKKESGRASEWEAIGFEDLYDDNPLLFTENPNSIQEEKYWFFQDRYMSILQKEQSCSFSAYAMHRIKGDWSSIQSNQVKRHPEDYDWIYDPDSFSVKRWDTESIDDLVKEIRPSRDCLKQLLQSEEWDAESIDDLVKKIKPSREAVEHLSKFYEENDRKVKRENRERRWKKIKSTPKRLQNWLDDYDKLMIAIITLASGAVGLEVIKAIIRIITSSEN